MNGTDGDYIKGNKPDTEKKIPHVLIHLWKLISHPWRRTE